MDMLRFAMKDVMFNLVVENIFTAPFQRFQTSQAVDVKDAQCTAMDITTIHNEQCLLRHSNLLVLLSTICLPLL